MKKLELLAPAGSKESFITALRAGADSVYIGVANFNARISASNLNFYDLEVLIDHAHQKGVKVFLALNTLIKHEEVHEVVKSITAIDNLKPDAVIVQDLGIASIIKNYFPDISLHASTQMAVHNRMGVDFLAKAGFKRVIMARELSFSELKLIAKNSPIEIEIFCHGALCFSLSGMCLFSSFIGGLSGNRGRCTQPCRRLWQNGGKYGYLFSPRDLELAEYIDRIKKIGITGLKIEGRMRSSEYVYRTVKAYRMIIDAPESDFKHALKEAKEILSNDAAREKTTCLFSGRDTEMFQPRKAQCLGSFIGTIGEIAGGSISIDTANNDVKIMAGDRLRLSNPDTDTTIAFKIKEFSKQDGKYTVPFSKTDGFVRGNPVFRTVDASLDQKNIQEDIDALYKTYAAKRARRPKDNRQASQDYTALISNKWKANKNLIAGKSSSDNLWVRFDNILWFDFLKNIKGNTSYVYYLTKDNLYSIDEFPYERTENIAVELPPFIGQHEVMHFSRAVEKLLSKGINKWVLNNVSQFEFFGEHECELISGPFLYTWNAYTAEMLSGLGIKYFTVSWEDDFLNVRRMSNTGLGKQLLIYLYGFVPVVRSRMITKDMLDNDIIKERLSNPEVSNKKSASFTNVFESGLALLLPEKPFNIFKWRKKLNECGIHNFGIDLSFTKPDKKLFDSIYKAYQKNENLPDSTKFNFKQSIK